MNHKNTLTSGAQFEMAYHAMKAAFKDGLSFTAEGFCKRYGHKLNRHSRSVLNHLVEQGCLVKRKTLYNDSHYRMVYAAPNYKPRGLLPL